MIKTLLAKKVYENKYVDIYDDDVQFPNGQIGTYYYSAWKAPYGVAVIPIVQRQTLLIRNYRYAEKDYSLEIPQGFGSKNSDPMADAKRELMEETSLAADSLEYLFATGKRFCTHIFLARFDDFSNVSHANAEQHEDILSHELLNLNDVSIEKIRKLEIYDPITIVALLAISTSMKL